MLAMWMGTGKSRVAIEIARVHDFKLLLIECPLRVIDVWREQLALHAPGAYTVLALEKGAVAEKTLEAKEHISWARRGHPAAIVVNYESSRVAPFNKLVTQTSWDLVVADESHRLKAASGLTSRFMGRLGLVARYRLALTGTPVPHCPLDIWGQFRFLNRSVLDLTFTSYRARHAEMGGYKNKEVRAWKDMETWRQNFDVLAFQAGKEVLDLPAETLLLRARARWPAAVQRHGARLHRLDRRRAGRDRR
jgi:SNF2 family DNA or RNA helicase